MNNRVYFDILLEFYLDAEFIKLADCILCG